jgi:dUTP pyrophosphatase
MKVQDALRWVHPKPTIKLKICGSSAPPYPFYSTKGAAAADVMSNENVTIAAGAWAKVHTGYNIEVPPGFRVDVYPRSGLASRSGVTVLNSPGLVDEDYRGELCVLLINHGPLPVEIRLGDRIAQLVLNKSYQANFEGAVELSETDRGEGGFGSTGV